VGHARLSRGDDPADVLVPARRVCVLGDDELVFLWPGAAVADSGVEEVGGNSRRASRDYSGGATHGGGRAENHRKVWPVAQAERRDPAGKFAVVEKPVGARFISIARFTRGKQAAS